MHIKRGSCFLCPACTEPILLPHRSLLGTCEGREYRPTGIWPIGFLCTQSLRVCECSGEEIRPEIAPVMDPHQGRGVLWQIDCECAHENCGVRSTVYTIHSADADVTEIVGMLLYASSTSICAGGHPLHLEKEAVSAKPLAP
jgi:hypothetical protein